MSEFYLPNRDSEKHLGKSKLKAAAVQTDGWVCDRETDVAILVAINQLTKQLGRTPTSYEVMWELHGQIPEEEIEKVALAADVRERTAT